MIISQNDLQHPKTIEILGTEPWLEPFYQGFPVPRGTAKPPLTGKLNFQFVTGDTSVEVSGKITYPPYLHCSACGHSAQLKLDLDVKAVFRPAPTELLTKKVHNLSNSELDDYYFTENGGIDIEGLINDIVNIAIPERPTCSDLGNTCSAGEATDSDSQMWSTNKSNQGKSNPFEILASLKDDEPQ